MEGRGFGMIARSFKSVIWVATVGGAALCCYMVSLRVATERADLAKVDREIFAAKREIRLLQTELGTRGRMTQLEDWNANVLALSAPSAAQFVKDDVTLARLERHEPTVAERSADVRMAAAETGAATAQPPAQPAQPAAPSAEAPKPRIVAAIAPHPAPPPAVHQASYTPAPKAAAAEAPKARKPERQAKAATKAAANPAVENKKAVAVAVPDKKAPKKAVARAGAEKKPEKKAVAKAGADKKLAHAKPARRPVAAQESDAD
jgi:hypothetical protein